MLDKSTIVKVSNRDNGTVGYTISEMGIHRIYQRGETKEITMEELRKLSYAPGGQAILNECLIIHNEEALKEINPDYEPEYFYTEKEITELLLYGSQAQFLDCLDFAPEGVINLLQQLAVQLEINNIEKREAIFEKTGFNVTKAIENNKSSNEAVEEQADKRRRTAAPVVQKTEPAATGRRTTTTTSGKYHVVKKN